MQEKDTYLSEEKEISIRSILDKAEENQQSGRTRSETNGDGQTEFVFDNAPVSGGFVFEQEDAGEPEASQTVGLSPTAEFVVPSSFEAQSTSETPSHIAQATSPYHVYIPTFTEASENYRMTGKTTLDPDEGTPAFRRRREEIKGPVVEVVAERANQATGPHSKATAEFVEETAASSRAEEVVVQINSPVRQMPSDVTETVSETVNERTLEDEQEDISRLFRRDADDTSVAETAVEAPPPSSTQEKLSPKTADSVMDDARTATQTAECRTTLADPIETSAPIGVTDKKAAVQSYRPRDGKKQNRRDEEHHKYSNSTKLKNRFLDSLMALRVRCIAVALLTVAQLFLALTPLMGIDLRQLLKLDDYKGLLAFFDLLLCVCTLLLVVPEIIAFCKQLYAKNVFYTLLPLASTVAVFAYDFYMMFAEITAYPLFGTMYSLGLLFVIFASYLQAAAMFSSFKIVSVKGTKRAVERVLTRTLEEENIALDGTIDEYRSYTARMFDTSFVTDFFHRHRPIAKHMDTVLFMMGLLFGCSVVIGSIACFLGDGLADGITALALVWLASTPVAALLTRPLTFAFAEKCCFEENCAILGEGAMYEYADVDVISFDDTEVFGRGDVALKRVLIYGDKSRLSTALRQMASLFMAVGGPLQTLFADTLDRRPLPASRIRMEADGISGETEGAPVHAGSATYMARLGFSIPDNSTQDAVGTTRALYLAENGVVYAKFTFRYAFSEEFSQLLPDFKEKGIVPLIYTRDPNVTNELLLALTTGEDSMRVMHLTTPAQADEAVPYGSAGMVTMGSKLGAINLILTAKKYVALQGVLRRVLIGQTVGGILLFGSLSFLPIATVLPWMLLWQGAWCALVAFLGARTFSLRKKRRELIEKEKELSHA